MAGIGVTILVSIGVVFVIKYLLFYFKKIKFNSKVHSPGIPYPVRILLNKTLLITFAALLVLRVMGKFKDICFRVDAKYRSFEP
jgi:hypothetical protein